MPPLPFAGSSAPTPRGPKLALNAFMDRKQPWPDETDYEANPAAHAPPVEFLAAQSAAHEAREVCDENFAQPQWAMKLVEQDDRYHAEHLLPVECRTTKPVDAISLSIARQVIRGLAASQLSRTTKSNRKRRERQVETEKRLMQTVTQLPSKGADGRKYRVPLAAAIGIIDGLYHDENCRDGLSRSSLYRNLRNRPKSDLG